jgi:tRNA (guanine37-N1)-methyltransferase
VRIDILTLFPALCEAPLSGSIAGRAREAGVVDVRVHNLRDWAEGRHRVTDDAPYGGGPGMVLKPEPVFAAVEALRTPGAHVVLMSPQGRPFDQARARAFAALPHLILIAGHYEGVDQRVADHLVDAQLSIGDYVLTNGAIAATVVADAVLRLLPGALGDAQSAEQDSFGAGLLDCPHYTRPVEFRGWRVPDILLSGNHAEIARWRAEQALQLTRSTRPDLLPPA